MKKLILLLLTLTLSLFALASCLGGGNEGDGGADECTAHTDTDGNLACDVCGAEVSADLHTHADSDDNLKCDGCGLALASRGTELLLDFAERLVDARSFKLDFVIETLTDEVYWSYTDTYTLEPFEYYEKMTASVKMLVAISDDGSVSAKADATMIFSEDKDGEPETENVTAYIIDGSSYVYNEVMDAYVCTPPAEDDEAAVTINQLLDLIADLEIADNTEQIAEKLGEALAGYYSFSGGKGTLTVDCKDDVNSFFTYFSELDLNKTTVADLINDLLAVLGSDTDAYNGTSSLFRFLDLTVNEALSVIDEALVGQYGMTLDECYTALITEPSVAEAIKAYLATEMGAVAAEEYYAELAAFTPSGWVEDMVLGDVKIYDILMGMMYSPEDNVTTPTLSELRQAIFSILSMTLADFDEQVGEGMFATLKESLGSIRADDLKLVSNIGLVGASIDYVDLALDIKMTQTTTEYKNKTNTSTTGMHLYVGISDLSSDTVEIKLDPTKEIYLDLCDNYFSDYSDDSYYSVYLTVDDDGVDVECSYYVGDVYCEVIASDLPFDVLKSTDFSIQGENCKLYCDYAEIPHDGASLIFSLDLDSYEVTVTSAPSPVTE